MYCDYKPQKYYMFYIIADNIKKCNDSVSYPDVENATLIGLTLMYMTSGEGSSSYLRMKVLKRLKNGLGYQ